jgi:tetratricopeptide (TPR) repeat protein
VAVVAAAAAVTAGAGGAAAWLLLGAWWTIAGVVVGLVIAMVCYLVLIRLVFMPDEAKLLRKNQPQQALDQFRVEIPAARRLARVWPGGFRPSLARYLALQAQALEAVHRDAEARRSLAEAVTIYQELAAAQPAKFAPDLAGALNRHSRLLAGAGQQAEAITAMDSAARLYRKLAVTDPATYFPALAKALGCKAAWLAEIELHGQALAAAHEAASIYEDHIPADELPGQAAQVMLLEGRLLCQAGRYHEALKPLARGWRLASIRPQPNLLQTAMPALKAAYRADPASFGTVWRTEAGGDTPQAVTQ